MTRQRVNLQLIENESTRRETFKMRCNSLMNKVDQLSTLCGIKTAVVVYGEGESRPQVYPSVPEARRLLNRFKAMPAELARWKKVTSQEEHLRGRISRLRERIRKVKLQRREDETSYRLLAAMAAGRGRGPGGLAGLTYEELVSLNSLVETKRRDAESRYEKLVGRGINQQEPPLPPQEQQPTLVSQPQASSYTYTDHQMMMPALEPVVEEPHQPQQQQDWLANFDYWNGREPGHVVSGDLGITSNDGSAGPSNSGHDTMQNCNMEGIGFPWSPNSFPTSMMEQGGYFDNSHAFMASYDA